MHIKLNAIPFKMNYKFIHIFWGEDLKFTPNFVETINDPEAGFDVNEHLFVSRGPKLYAVLKKYNNVIIDTTSSIMINKYAPQCQALILHGLPSVREILFSKNKYKRKTICRSWGGNRIIKEYRGTLFNNIITYCENMFVKLFFNFRFGKFRALGVGNIVDEIDIKKINPQIKLITFDGYSPKSDITELELESRRIKETNGVTNILVGHRGTKGENHIAILEKLRKFENERIAIYLILSYGDRHYINHLKEKIKEKGYKKIEIIDEFMSSQDYCKFLNTIDIAIFDDLRSTALGNISKLLMLKKKIFLNANGVIAKGFEIEKIPYESTYSINDMSFDVFCRKLDYSKCKNATLLVPISEYRAKIFNELHNLFNYCEKMNNESDCC